MWSAWERLSSLREAGSHGSAERPALVPGPLTDVEVTLLSEGHITERDRWGQCWHRVQGTLCPTQLGRAQLQPQLTPECLLPIRTQRPSRWRRVLCREAVPLNYRSPGHPAHRPALHSLHPCA